VEQGTGLGRPGKALDHIPACLHPKIAPPWAELPERRGFALESRGQPSIRPQTMSSGYYSWKSGGERWELQSTLLFMITSVLKSRTETGLESNTLYYDEDVNVYLAGLLAAYVDPAYTEWTAPFISRFDTDVATMVRASGRREKYWIYKVNADHLMLTLGIFEAASEPTAPTQGIARPPQHRVYVGRGGTYYELAASYGRALARRPTASIEVLEKLSRGFEGYVTILNYLRSHYFNLIDRLGHRGLDAIQKLIDEEARSTELKGRVDRLLDLYSEWRRTGDPALGPAIREAVEAIRALKPDFRFDFPG